MNDHDQAAAPVPVPVHVASIGAELGGHFAAAARSSSSPSSPTTRTVYRTVTLTANDPVQEIMAASDDRLGALVMAIEADIFLNENRSDASNGRGSYVPCVTPSAGKPSLQAPFPVNDRRVIFAAPVATLTGTNIIRISVTATYRD